MSTPQQPSSLLEQQQWALGPPAAPGALPDVGLENRAFGGMLAVAMAALLVVAGVYAYLASPAAVDLDLGGLDRLVLVKRFYDYPPVTTSQQLILAIGDSLTASGIDCAVLDELAGPHGYASYNLSTSSKVHSEFLLDLRQPRLRDATVITLVNPATFSLTETALLDRKANLIRVLGYPLARQDWADYAAAVPGFDYSYLFEPPAVHTFDSRWRLVTNLETGLRMHLPWVSAQTKQLVRYHREVYARDLKWAGMPRPPDGERTWRMLVEHMRDDPGWQSGSVAPAPKIVASFNFIHRRLEQTARHVVVVIAPVHPEMRAAAGEARMAACREYLGGLQSEQTTVVDCSALLSADEFRDEVHANRQGAARLTQAVAAALGWST